MQTLKILRKINYPDTLDVYDLCSSDMQVSLTLKFLYTVGILFHVEWCIR